MSRRLRARGTRGRIPPVRPLPMPVHPGLRETLGAGALRDTGGLGLGSVTLVPAQGLATPPARRLVLCCGRARRGSAAAAGGPRPAVALRVGTHHPRVAGTPARPPISGPPGARARLSVFWTCTGRRLGSWRRVIRPSPSAPVRSHVRLPARSMPQWWSYNHSSGLSSTAAPSGTVELQSCFVGVQRL